MENNPNVLNHQPIYHYHSIIIPNYIPINPHYRWLTHDIPIQSQFWGFHIIVGQFVC